MTTAAVQGAVHTPSNTRTWRNHFPNGDLWVFGYGSLIWKPPPHFDKRVPGYIKGYVRRFWQDPEFSYDYPKGIAYYLRDKVLTDAFFHSGDHRGTPESPGRVVTVIERSFWETLGDPQAHLETSSTSTVWGAAYHIPASHAEEVHDYLDEREIDGYTVHYTPFYPISPVSASTVSTTPVSSTAAGDDDPGSAPRFQPSSLPSSSSSSSNPSPMTCMVYIGLPTNSQFLRDPAQRDPAAVAKVISVSRGLSGKNTEYLYLLEKALEGLGLGSADGHVTDLVRRVKALEKEEAEAAESKAEGEVKRTFDPSQMQTHDEFPKNE